MAISVNLTSQGKLTELVKEVSGHYIDVKKSELKTFLRVQDYDGTTEGNIIIS